jgi:flagellar basal body-associated protein FliL
VNDHRASALVTVIAIVAVVMVAAGVLAAMTYLSAQVMKELQRVQQNYYQTRAQYSDTRDWGGRP